MTRRDTFRPQELAEALGSEVTEAHDQGHPGLMVAFRVESIAPHPPLRLTLFPYSAPEWQELVESCVALEVQAWRTWWQSVPPAMAPEGTGVWPIPPLFLPIEQVIRPWNFSQNGKTWWGYLRPWLDWPSVRETDLTEQQLELLWGGFASTAQKLHPGLRFPSKVPVTPTERQRLLTDGLHLVPSRWRSFDPAFHELEP